MLPALVFLPFLLTSFPLLLIGYFKPIPVIVLWLALTAAIVPYVWRRIPSVTGAADWGTADAGRATPTPRWVLWTLVAISVVFGVFQAVYHSQFVIDQLDAASYMNFASWISQHGSLPIPQDSAAFGHAPGIEFASAAFYQVGSSIVPQFMAGLPMLLSLGFWAGGARLAVFWAPVLGALGVFTFGGLVARLVGPRWAPLGALVMAIGIPEAYVSGSGDIIRVDKQCGLTNQGCGTRFPGEHERAAVLAQDRPFLGYEVHAVPYRVDQEHVCKPARRQRARVVVPHVKDKGFPVRRPELGVDVRC